MKVLMRKLLPDSTKTSVKRGMERLNQSFFPFFTHSERLASFYYFAFSGQFRREHRAVLSGRLAYRNSKGVGHGSSALLRRNTHRLEKGLIMKPRRSVFAEGYIFETVSCYRDCVVSESVSASEIKWAEDVLSEFFSVVDRTPVISRSKQVFDTVYEPIKSGNNIPYMHSSLPNVPFSYDDFKILCTRRRSVRWYESQPVPNELLNKAIGIASLAPSACNRQSFAFHIANDKNKASDIASLAGGTDGFADNIPCLVIVVGDLSAYPMERDRHIIYVDGSLAAMQFMLALETVGLSSCALNWPDIEVPERRLSSKLGLKPHERPIMLISVGFADKSGLIPFSQKKSVEQLRRDID